MMPFFSPVIFSGYGDGANGFYSVYSGVFNDITRFEKYCFAMPIDLKGKSTTLLISLRLATRRPLSKTYSNSTTCGQCSPRFAHSRLSANTTRAKLQIASSAAPWRRRTARAATTLAANTTKPCSASSIW